MDIQGRNQVVSFLFTHTWQEKIAEEREAQLPLGESK
tara:strand:- start:127 stop:237 length:111 start_codon:yes stop_codon:yes gene_type:complete